MCTHTTGKQHVNIPCRSILGFQQFYCAILHLQKQSEPPKMVATSDLYVLVHIATCFLIASRLDGAGR